MNKAAFYRINKDFLPTTYKIDGLYPKYINNLKKLNIKKNIKNVCVQGIV